MKLKQQRRFEEWMKQNEAKIEAKKSGLEKSQDDELGKRLEVEKTVNEARAAKLAKRNADLAAKAAAGDKAEAAARRSSTVRLKQHQTTSFRRNCIRCQLPKISLRNS